MSDLYEDPLLPDEEVDPTLLVLQEIREEIHNLAFQVETSTLLSYLSNQYKGPQLAEIAKRLGLPDPREEGLFGDLTTGQ